MMPHPVSQDGCSDIGPGTDDVIGRFWFGLDHDWWGYLVPTTLPVFVEVEDDEFPFNPIADSAANDLLPRRVLSKTKPKSDYKTLHTLLEWPVRTSRRWRVGHTPKVGRFLFLQSVVLLLSPVLVGTKSLLLRGHESLHLVLQTKFMWPTFLCTDLLDRLPASPNVKLRIFLVNV